MIDPIGISGSLAVSAQSLDKLRMQARQAPDLALKQAAQQFEAVFMNMMLKSMREATPQDGMFDSEQTRMFTGMLDQQLAQSMSSRGVGLADIMLQQLSRSSGASLSSLGSGAVQQDFVQRMAPHAMQASLETGVPVQLVLGQAALESGWGQREIRAQDGSSSYNLFGIKAGDSWHGKVAEIMTTEYHNGIPARQVEKFRAYSSYAEAFSDYAQMLRDNPRYAQVIQPGQGAPETAHALQRAGYATDPNYAEKLVSVMSRINNLS